MSQFAELLSSGLAVASAATAAGIVVRQIPAKGTAPTHLMAGGSAFAIAYAADLMSTYGQHLFGLSKGDLEPALIVASSLVNASTVAAALLLIRGTSFSRRALGRAMVTAVGFAGSVFMTLQASHSDALIKLGDVADASLSCAAISLFGYAVSATLAGQGKRWLSWSTAATTAVFALAESLWFSGASWTHPVGNLAAVMMAYLYVQTLRETTPPAPVPALAG